MLSPGNLQQRFRERYEEQQVRRCLCMLMLSRVYLRTGGLWPKVDLSHVAGLGSPVVLVNRPEMQSIISTPDRECFKYPYRS